MLRSAPEEENFLEFSLVTYYSVTIIDALREILPRALGVLCAPCGEQNIFFQEIVNVQSRQVFKSMQA